MAVTATTVWEVWSNGSSTNGGGFDASVASPGTDYSQQSAVQKTYTDLVIGAVNTDEATSVLVGFTASDVGNVYNVISGTGFTVQRVVLISVTGGTPSTAVGKFNAAIGTAGSVGGNARMGGAVPLTTPAVVAGNKVWVKATATYSVSITAAILNTAGTIGAYIEHEGYTTTRPSGTAAQSGGTRGDGGQVTVQRSSSSNFTVISGSGAFHILRNFIADGASAATMTGFGPTGSNTVLENCKAINCSTAGFTINTGNRIQLFSCWATACSGTAGFNIVIAFGTKLIGCMASDNTCTGFLVNHPTGAGLAIFIDCIADTNTGGSSPGFRIANSATATFQNCIAYANGSDGILLDTTANAAAADAVSIINCILEANSGFGINANAANIPSLWTDYNAFYNNNGGGTQRNNVPTGVHDVTLTGSAFTNAAGQNFALNSTASAGAACRAVGFPGVLQVGGTGFVDIGALQHADPAGSGGMIMSRVRTGM